MESLSPLLILLVGGSMLLVVSGMVSCSQGSSSNGGSTVPPAQAVATVQHISVDEFEAMRSSTTNPYLLDVREPIELTTKGQIPGVVNIPLGEILARRSELPADREAPIYAVCQTGNRSKKAAGQLVQLGYRNVYTLDGGTGEWIARHK